MTTRTFIQQGQGYGSTPVSIVATVNGSQVFSEVISTLNQPLPDLPFGPFTGVNLFSWTNEVSFQGTWSYVITVTGGTLIMGDTVANYVSEPSFGGSPKTAEGFGYFWLTPYNENLLMFDPLSNVSINGIAKTVDRSNGPETGQFYWILPAGSSFSATINVRPGIEQGVPQPVQPTL